jgi:hypothetical protein
MIARLLLLIMACSMAFVAPLATSPAEAKKRKKTTTVTRTFRSEGGVTVPPTSFSYMGDPYPLKISVKGFKKAKIVDVDVVLRGLFHPRPDDIDMLLLAPNGRDAILMSDAGGEHPPRTVTITLNDEAPQFLPDSGTLTSGAFRTSNYPTNNDTSDAFYLLDTGSISGNRLLSTFDGMDPNGEWRLYVVSDTSSPGGSIGSVELKIKAKVKKR